VPLLVIILTLISQDPFQAGISQLPFGIGLLIMSFISGALVKRLGSWPFCFLGNYDT
jgi:hypothetical protein